MGLAHKDTQPTQRQEVYHFMGREKEKASNPDFQKNQK